MEKCNNLYLLNMLQISILFGTIYFLVKTAPKVRGLGKDYLEFCVLFSVDRLTLPRYQLIMEFIF